MSSMTSLHALNSVVLSTKLCSGRGKNSAVKFHSEIKGLTVRGCTQSGKQSKGGRRLQVKCLSPADHVENLPHLFVAVGVGLPCTVMQCGDFIHRSTLQANDQFKVTAGGISLLVTAWAYLWATPGVAPGFWDMFILGPIEQRLRKQKSKNDFNLGKKMGEGGYGTVFKATYAHNKQSGNETGGLVVKRANEFGAAEIWMNERVRRACPRTCADFLYGFVDKNNKNGGKGEFYLVWRFEGNNTLANLMASKDFPYNIEAAMTGVKDVPRSVERERKIIRSLMRQVLTCLQDLHSVGLVHRDIKPQNLIFSEDAKRLKVIDLGAAADLRVGINYAPKEFLLDPRYAAPEQYIMSTQTPSAPPPPIAAILSPVLWQMNLPDRFDMYSAGLIFLQMAFANLRSDSALISFNRQLKRCNYDLEEWRSLMEKRGGAEYRKGFEFLDADGGNGWSLLQSLLSLKPRKRTSAGGALAHPFFYPGSVNLLQRVRLAFLRVAYRDNSELQESVVSYLSKTGTPEGGGFTEAQLEKLRERQRKAQKNTVQRNALAAALKIQRKAARTMSFTTVDEFAKIKESASWWNRWES